MILVICMAGRNTRFHDAGFDVPKYLLPLGEHTVIYEIIQCLTKDYKFDHICLLPNQRDKYFLGELLASVQHFGITNENIFMIPDTNGQAHTAAIGAQFVIDNIQGKKTPIAFHNSDTIIENRNFAWVAEELKSEGAYIDVFAASSSDYSYVTMESMRVTRMVEKQVISPFASSGFYAFSSAEFYLQSLSRLIEENNLVGDAEVYVSAVMQDIIERDVHIFASDLSHDTRTTVLGSPQEYGLELARRQLINGHVFTSDLSHNIRPTAIGSPREYGVEPARR